MTESHARRLPQAGGRAAAASAWYALRTYYAQELKMGNYLERSGVEFFIPMMLRERMDAAGKAERQLRPAVHNLIFIRQQNDLSALRAVIGDSPYPVSVYRKQESEEWCEITDKDILELRLICDQHFSEPTFITQEEGELKVGRMVRVKHGPLSGITGKLVRKNRKYYIVKTMTGLGVMVAVSRWCCEGIDDNNNT